MEASSIRPPEVSRSAFEIPEEPELCAVCGTNEVYLGLLASQDCSLNLHFTTGSPLRQNRAQAWGLPSTKLLAAPSSSVCSGRGWNRAPLPHRRPRPTEQERHILTTRVRKEATTARKIGESLGLIGDKIKGLIIDQQTD